MEQQGFGDLVAPPPRLLPDADLALQCWAWCAGWMPERWALFDAFHHVPDWALLQHLQEHIRTQVAATRKT